MLYTPQAIIDGRAPAMQPPIGLLPVSCTQSYRQTGPEESSELVQEVEARVCTRNERSSRAKGRLSGHSQVSKRPETRTLPLPSGPQTSCSGEASSHNYLNSPGSRTVSEWQVPGFPTLAPDHGSALPPRATGGTPCGPSLVLVTRFRFLGMVDLCIMAARNAMTREE